MSEDLQHPLYCEDVPESFQAGLDVIGPDACSRATLVEFIMRAPTPESRAYLWGILDARLVYALISGGTFSDDIAPDLRHLRHPILGNTACRSGRLRDLLDAIDPCSCLRSELKHLIGNAPDSISTAYFQGILELRDMYSLASGSSFHRFDSEEFE